MLWDPSNMYRYTADALRPVAVASARTVGSPGMQAGQQDSR
jgi:hypothetical protein